MQRIFSKKTKRYVALLLSIVMTLSVLPYYAFAGQATPNTEGNRQGIGTKIEFKDPAAADGAKEFVAALSNITTDSKKLYYKVSDASDSLDTNDGTIAPTVPGTGWTEIDNITGTSVEFTLTNAKLGQYVEWVFTNADDDAVAWGNDAIRDTTITTGTTTIDSITAPTTVSVSDTSIEFEVATTNILLSDIQSTNIKLYKNVDATAEEVPVTTATIAFKEAPVGLSAKYTVTVNTTALTAGKHQLKIEGVEIAVDGTPGKVTVPTAESDKFTVTAATTTVDLTVTIPPVDGVEGIVEVETKLNGSDDTTYAPVEGIEGVYKIPSGNDVKLTAKAKSGSKFTAWSGIGITVPSIPTDPLVLSNFTGEKTVTATFATDETNDNTININPKPVGDEEKGLPTVTPDIERPFEVAFSDSFAGASYNATIIPKNSEKDNLTITGETGSGILTNETARAVSATVRVKTKDGVTITDTEEYTLRVEAKGVYADIDLTLKADNTPDPEINHTLTVTIAPTTDGTVAVTDKDGTALTPEGGSYSITNGEKVTLTATAGTDKYFSHWSSSDGSNITISPEASLNRVFEFTPTGETEIDYAITANFTTVDKSISFDETNYEVTVKGTEEADIEITFGAGFATTDKIGVTLDPATDLTIIDPDSDLDNLTIGDLTDNKLNVKVKIKAGHTVTDTDKKTDLNVTVKAADDTLVGSGKTTITVKPEDKTPTQTLTITNPVGGAVEVSVDGTKLELASSYTIAQDADVTLKAVPNKGYKFVTWTSTGYTFPAGTDMTTNPFAFTMPKNDVSMGANFETGAITLTPPTDTNLKYRTGEKTGNFTVTYDKFDDYNVEFYKKGEATELKDIFDIEKSTSGTAPDIENNFKVEIKATAAELEAKGIEVGDQIDVKVIGTFTSREGGAVTETDTATITLIYADKELSIDEPNDEVEFSMKKAGEEVIFTVRYRGFKEIKEPELNSIGTSAEGLKFTQMPATRSLTDETVVSYKIEATDASKLEENDIVTFEVKENSTSNPKIARATIKIVEFYTRYELQIDQSIPNGSVVLVNEPSDAEDSPVMAITGTPGKYSVRKDTIIGLQAKPNPSDSYQLEEWLVTNGNGSVDLTDTEDDNIIEFVMKDNVNASAEFSPILNFKPSITATSTNNKVSSVNGGTVTFDIRVENLYTSEDGFKFEIKPKSIPAEGMDLEYDELTITGSTTKNGTTTATIELAEDIAPGTYTYVASITQKGITVERELLIEVYNDNTRVEIGEQIGLLEAEKVANAEYTLDIKGEDKDKVTNIRVELDGNPKPEGIAISLESNTQITDNKVKVTTTAPVVAGTYTFTVTADMRDGSNIQSKGAILVNEAGRKLFTLDKNEITIPQGGTGTINIGAMNLDGEEINTTPSGGGVYVGIETSQNSVANDKGTIEISVADTFPIGDSYKYTVQIGTVAEAQEFTVKVIGKDVEKDELTIITDGVGSGTVSVMVNGQTLTSGSPYEIAPGSEVILTANPANNGSTFEGWKHNLQGVSSNGDIIRFTMPSGNVTVTATFANPTKPVINIEPDSNNPIIYTYVGGTLKFNVTTTNIKNGSTLDIKDINSEINKWGKITDEKGNETIAVSVGSDGIGTATIMIEINSRVLIELFEFDVFAIYDGNKVEGSDTTFQFEVEPLKSDMSVEENQDFLIEGVPGWLPFNIVEMNMDPRTFKVLEVDSAGNPKATPTPGLTPDISIISKTLKVETDGTVPSGLYYFRIEGKDYDGAERISNIVKLKIVGEDEKFIIVNPKEYEVAKGGKLELDVNAYNLNGEKVTVEPKVTNNKNMTFDSPTIVASKENRGTATINASASDSAVDGTYEYVAKVFDNEGVLLAETTFTITVTSEVITKFKVGADVISKNMGIVTGTGLYPVGEEVTLTAYPEMGYMFVEWLYDINIVSKGQDEDGNPIIKFEMPESDVVIRAQFSESSATRFNVQATIDPANSGSVTGEGNYNIKEEVTLTATPKEGYRFAGWEDKPALAIDTVDGEGNGIIKFSMPDKNVVVKAKFISIDAPEYSVQTEVEPENTGEITGDGNYVEGEEVVLVATAKEGYKFARWENIPVGAIESTDNDGNSVLTFDMPADDVKVKAVFIDEEVDVYAVTAIIDPTNSGTVDNTGDYIEGNTVTLVAKPNTNFSFVDWENIPEGATKGTNNDGNSTLTFSMPASNVEVTAKFTAVTETLYDFEVTPSSNGTVSGTNEGSYAEGTAISITASANSGYKFSRWELEGLSGDVNLSNPTLSFTMPANKVAVKAIFVEEDATLYTLAINASTGGTVSGTNEGSYAEGEEISLEAIADTGYKFDKWEITGITVSDLSNKNLSFKMPDNDVTIKPIFVEDGVTPVDKYTLNVTEKSTGGTVSGTKSGEYAEGTDVNLKATADTGYEFDKWEVTGITVSDLSNKDLSFKMPANDVTIKPIFVEDGTTEPEKDYQLTVIAISNGGTITNNGTVTGNPSGKYKAGTNIDLTAVANDGYKFIGWDIKGLEDDVNTSEANVKFVMPANNVTAKAIFEKESTPTPGRRTVRVTTENGGIVSGSGKYDVGQKVTIKANDTNNYQFVEWITNDIILESTTAREVSFIMPDNDVTIRARFNFIGGNGNGGNMGDNSSSEGWKPGGSVTGGNNSSSGNNNSNTGNNFASTGNNTNTEDKTVDDNQKSPIYLDTQVSINTANLDAKKDVANNSVVVEIPADKVRDAFKYEGNNNVVIDLVTLPSDITSITVKLNSDYVHAMESLRFDYPAAGKVKYDSRLLKEIGPGRLIEFTIRKGSLVAQLKIDGQIYHPVDPKIKATYYLPYSLGAGQSAEYVVAYKIATNGVQTIIANSKYDTYSKQVVFEESLNGKFDAKYNFKGYSDVSQGAWYSEAVNHMASREVIAGAVGGSLAPDDKISRADFLVMVMKTYGIEPDSQASSVFLDAGDTYYTDYLNTAKTLGLVSGVGNDMFDPTAEITRQDMLVILYNILDKIDEMPTQKSQVSVYDFNDVGNVSDYAINTMDHFVKAEVVNGSDNNLMPTSSTSRAEAIQIVYNLVK